MPAQAKSQPKRTRFFLLVCVLAAGSIWLGLSQENRSVAQSQLPPRPTLAPTATPQPPTATPIVPATPGSPTAIPASQPVRIRLIVENPAYRDAWSLVQWLDGVGNWHDVNGWLGQMAGGEVQWHVLPQDYDTGPFRWVILDAPDGAVLAASKPFDLPNSGVPLLLIDNLSR